MKRTLGLLALCALAFTACDSGLTDVGADREGLSTYEDAGKRAKTVICHVGSQVGIDAGQVSLIDVPYPEKHLENPSHSYAGLRDYLPDGVGATGEGREDSNGNGIADGCELPAVACPCWAPGDLDLITVDNVSPDACTPGGSAAPNEVGIWTAGDFPWGYAAATVADPSGPYCKASLYPSEQILSVTLLEAAACVAQIADRCDAILAPAG